MLTGECQGIGGLGLDLIGLAFFGQGDHAHQEVAKHTSGALGGLLREGLLCEHTHVELEVLHFRLDTAENI